MSRRRLGAEDGWVLPAALGLLVAMISLGLALLTVVDAQTKESGQQPRRDAALNLAETALSGSSFALSRSWPTVRDPNVPWTNQGTCATQSLTGSGSGTSPSGTTAFAANVQQLVAQAWASRPDAPTSRWSLHVCDDTGAGGARSTIWSDSGLANAAYDANGAETVAASGTQPQYKRRRLWVRAQATVSGRSRAVAGLVQVVEQPALPPGYATVAGKVSYTTNSSTSPISELLGSTTQATQGLLTGLVGNGSSTGIVRGGTIGVRCGVLDLCVDSTVGTITDIPLVRNLGLLQSQVKQFGAPTAASADAIDRLRQQAIQSGRYVAATDAGKSCFLNAPNPTAGGVTFIEKVGGGDDVCTIAATGSNAVGTVVVNNGRVDVQGSGKVDAVIYAQNGQNDRTLPIVHITRGVTVNGGVYVDGGGMLGLDQPSFSTSQLINDLCSQGALGTLTCLVGSTLRLLGADQLIDSLLRLVPPTTLVSALLPQLTGGTNVPAVTLDTTQTNQVVTYGTAGTIQQSFREVPPRAGG